MNYIGRTSIVMTLVLASLCCNGMAEEPCEVLGMISMTPVTETSCAAIYIPVSSDKAISGLRWYNNDDLTVFPKVYVASGMESEPAAMDEAIEVAALVQGPALGWAEVIFAEPYASSGGGLYCIVMFPEEQEYLAMGTGGGAAIGYTGSTCGHQGWLGSQGESWMRIADPYGLAIEPILIDSDPSMAMLKAMSQSQGDVVTAPVMLSARPNPFNPMTEFDISLPKRMNVEVTVYNVRGIMVRRLVADMMEKGSHTVLWDGCDQGGKRTSSGLYVVRFKAGSVVQHQRVMMVK